MLDFGGCDLYSSATYTLANTAIINETIWQLFLVLNRTLLRAYYEYGTETNF